MFDLPFPFVLIIVFLWVFADAVFPVSLFVPGEPVFLYIGFVLLEPQGTSLLITALVGGFTADQASYWIGRFYGRQALKRFRSRKRRRQIAHMRIILKRHGVLFVIISRIMGPVAWVMPVLSGSLKLSPVRFSMASAIGCTIGIGQFIALGYLSRIGSDLFSWRTITDYAANPFIVTGILIFGTGLFFCMQLFYKKRRKEQIVHS